MILCLHYLGENRRLAITLAQLDAIVEKERAAGRRLAPLAEAARDSSRLALTFDDAHRSILALAARDIPATVFVPTDFVGMSDEVLSWDDLRALRDAGWTIGSHARTHTRMSWRLYDEDAAAYARRLDDEAARSREILEQKLGITIRDFAYPYGGAPPEARRAVARAGYERAFTVSETLDWNGDPHMIPRLDGMEAHGLVRARSHEPTKISVVVPACDRHETLTEVVARLSAQNYPEDSFEVIVVDDGSKTSLRPCVGPKTRLIERAGDASTFRAGAARQRGADEARFDTLAFLDADVAVERDFLWALDWIHQRVDDAVVLGYLSGYNLHDIGFTHSVEAARKGDMAVIPDRSREPTLRGCFDNVDWLAEPWRLAYTGNLSVTRAALARAGGFARDFSGWGLEDLDLGYRLFASGARFVFSRFAVGYHIVDANEPAPRNPFRARKPERSHFVGYEKNLVTLASLHPRDPAIERFVAQARSDIDETCGRPDTVGVEFGGACPLECAFHRKLHRCQPGGVSTQDLLDRLAYATKVGARSLYLLGGEPVSHPGFFELLRAAKTAGIRRITTETTALPFAADGVAREAREAGLDRAIVEILAFDEPSYDAITRSKGHFSQFLGGIDRLREAGVSCSAKVVGANLVSEARARGFDIEAVVDGSAAGGTARA